MERTEIDTAAGTQHTHTEREREGEREVTRRCRTAAVAPV
jgi:hypothetical protein